MKNCVVVGAGLAGCEAAYYLAQRGVKVKLFEQRPKKRSEAHHTDLFAELVCSNSLRSNEITNAVGLLKEEMRILGSLILDAASVASVPAGSALAVDRIIFSEYITNKIQSHPSIEVVNEEYVKLEDVYTIVCTGPLTSDTFSKEIVGFLGSEYFNFFDAAAPIVSVDSIDMNKVYLKSRYDKGEASYLNCPMTQSEFDVFYDALVSAELAELHDFEVNIFEGCMPIEVMAKRGKKTLLFGPMKPVGLENEDQKPYAVVQLRQDNAAKSLYNLVGFQTHLKWGEQKRVLRLIPGLENVEIERYGVMHKNSYINSPVCLKPSYQSKVNDKIFFAGQITGVEGYVESAASGLLAAINMFQVLEGKPFVEFDRSTCMGALSYYVTHASSVNFQPMNITFGIMRPLQEQVSSKELKKQKLSERALSLVSSYKDALSK